MLTEKIQIKLIEAMIITWKLLQLELSVFHI